MVSTLLIGVPSLKTTKLKAPTQINQFIFFQNFTRILRSQGIGPMITDQEFGDAIYAIDIGQNDLSSAFNGTEYSVIETIIIPKILENIENAVKNLYDVGARKYYLYNTGPLAVYRSWHLGTAPPIAMTVMELGAKSFIMMALRLSTRDLLYFVIS
uniref:Uncharacterized protein n=1 Tax=Opuntia streptacantha TaxID=393608 RepID=A0A7C8ZUB2_OPUST